ncbi:MAG: DHHA1 domain-containing protein, partial [Candidatus Aenigmatarchaeota archaeon]
RRVIENKDVKDQYLVSNTGIISEDNISSVSQSADFISKQEKIDVAIVSGIDEDNEKIQISVRAMGTKNNAEDIVMEGYNKFPGSKVGGRKKAAGGSIPLGFTKYSLGDDGFAEFIFKNIKKAAWDAVGKD